MLKGAIFNVGSVVMQDRYRQCVLSCFNVFRYKDERVIFFLNCKDNHHLPNTLRTVHPWKTVNYGYNRNYRELMMVMVIIL